MLASSTSSPSNSDYGGSYFCFGGSGFADRVTFGVLVAKALKGGLIVQAVGGLDVEQICKWQDEGETAYQGIKHAYNPDYLDSCVVVPVHVRNIFIAIRLLMLSKIMVKIMNTSMLRRNK